MLANFLSLIFSSLIFSVPLYSLLFNLFIEFFHFIDFISGSFSFPNLSHTFDNLLISSFVFINVLILCSVSDNSKICGLYTLTCIILFLPTLVHTAF